jgi:CheY-like chemotaxis protein
MRVLIADDKETWHTLFDRVLSIRGMEVVHARAPKEVVSVAASTHPDVIVLDYSLAGGTAEDIILPLKELEIPIILTGYRAEGFDPEKFRRHGISEILEKPFTVKELLDALERVSAGISLPSEVQGPQFEEEAFTIEEPSEAEVQIIDLEETPVETIEIEAPVELPDIGGVEEPEKVEVAPLELSAGEEVKEKKEEFVEKVAQPVASELSGLTSLPPAKVEEIIREVAWEVIPEIAEKVIREEIQKLIESRLA